MRDDDKRTDETEEVEDRGGIGAEGGDSENTDTPPAAPADDDTPLGDTDQHSQVPPPPRTGR